MAIVINGSGTVTGLAVGGLPDGTVDSGTLATDSVSAAKIAANSVDSAELIDGAVDRSHLATSIADSGNATAMTIDSSENVGFGVVPETWHSGYKGFQVSALSLMAHKTTPTVHTMGNAYHNGSAYKYVITGVATQHSMEGGDHVFRTAASGSADANITWTDQLSMKADGRGLSQFTAKAWGKFNGTGTPAYADSHNCSSLTDVGTGHYTVNFSNSMANTNYSKVVDCRDVNHSTTLVVAHSSDTYGTGSFQVLLQYIGVSNGAVDEQDIHFIVFGD